MSEPIPSTRDIAVLSIPPERLDDLSMGRQDVQLRVGDLWVVVGNLCFRAREDW